MASAFTRANPYLDEIVEILQRHLEKYQGDPDKARQHLSKADNEWIDQEFIHCMQDTRYFLSNYYAIKTEEKGYQGLYPFWDSQEILHDEFRRMEKRYGKVRAMINKARQMGASTYVSGEMFHKTIFTEHINTHVVAQDADQSRFIFDMYTGALDFLPWWMRPRVRYAEAGKFLDFDEKDDVLRDLRPGMKTRIYVDNGNKPTGAGRGKCQVPWTYVWTEQGAYSLEDLFFATCHDAVGIPSNDGIGEWFEPKREVFTWAFNGQNMERKRVSRIFRQHYTGPIDKIQVANGVTVEKTPEHRLLSSREWKRCLSAGDHVDCIRDLEWHGTEHPSSEFAELLAWHIAEGCDGTCHAVQITQKEPSTRERIASLAYAVTGRVPLNRDPKDLKTPNRSGYVSISGKDYRQLLEQNGYIWGPRSAKKKIPRCVFRWDKESIAIFLRGFFEAEGSVGDKVEIISASRHIMESLRMLCAIFGVSLRVRPCIKYASNTKRKVRRTYYRGNISGASLEPFNAQVGFLSQRKSDLLADLVAESSGYTLQQYPRITQMFRDACREANIPTKKILGDHRLAKSSSMSLKVARSALSRMDAIVDRLPQMYPNGVHRFYRNCNQEVLGRWADKIRQELSLGICEEEVEAVSSYDYEGYIYDLEVQDTHNYPTAGVITHNTFKRAHLDELAFWTNPSQLTKALFPTMNASDGFYVMVSTPNGRNDAWHNLWRKAESGKIDWHPIYIPYYRREKTYFLPISAGEKFEPTEEELEMRQQVLKKEGYFVKDETLNWARNKKEEFIATDGDDKMFSQEYSSNAEESFQTSATTAYGRTLINRLSKKTDTARWVGEIAYDFKADKPLLHRREVKPWEDLLCPETENRFHIWEMPIVGERYVMGVDVSLGNDGGDYSCVQVLKLPSGHEKDEQVAVWHGLITPEDLAEIVYAIGWMYNEALAAVEVNSMGMVTNSELVRHLEYENIYRFKRMDRLKNFITDIIGWWTDEKSKRALMSKMSKALLSDTITLRDKHTVNEFYDFNDEYEAEGDGAHDDYMMALHIALYCGHEGEDRERQQGKKEASEGRLNVFEIKDRFGTIIATTNSQNEAQRISKLHLGSVTERTATATTTVTMAGKKRKVPADLFNTDWSPIHDGEGSAHRMFYEEGMEEEAITSEAIAEYEAQLEELENDPQAWLYT